MNYLDPYDEPGKGCRVVGWFILAVLIIVVLLFLDGCITTQVKWERTYTATTKRFVDSLTGRYMIVEANCITIQHMWKSVAPDELKHLDRVAFTRLDTMQIWYCTEAGLKEELHNIQSYRNLMEAAHQDYRDAFPLIQPPMRR